MRHFGISVNFDRQNLLTRTILFSPPPFLPTHPLISVALLPQSVVEERGKQQLFFLLLFSGREMGK